MTGEPLRACRRFLSLTCWSAPVAAYWLADHLRAEAALPGGLARYRRGSPLIWS